MTPRPLRIIQMVAGIGHEASGPSYSVPRLCRALAERGHDVELHVLAWEDTPSVPGVGLRIYPLVPFPRSAGFSPWMRLGLRRAVRGADLVHTHGLWMMPNIYAPAAATKFGVKLVTSPRGSFAEWALARSKWKKRAMWWGGQGSAVTNSDMFHATSESERADIRRLGLAAPIALIPNGIDIPDPRTRVGAGRARRRALFLGRVHPVKGVDMLLRAWKHVEAKFPDWELEIVGRPAGNYGEEMRMLARDLGLARVTFSGPLYGREKANAYANADLFVLPTHTENFGMTVAEALAASVPVIVTRGAPWEGLVTARCGWWIDRSDAILTETMASAMALPPGDLEAMGKRGRTWMEQDFSWASVAQRMEKSYRWLLDDEEQPAWLDVDTSRPGADHRIRSW
jgi:glycosyltransferase involved in cell wall biosynthesis